MKILCIGHSSWDITVPVDEYPTENKKYRYNEKYSAGGGPSGNAAFLLGKWGMDTTIAATIGSDDFGTKIKKEFQSVNVDTNYLETNYEKDTSLSFILINKQNGLRTIYNVATEHPPLKKLNYEFTPDIVFTDGHDYGASQNAISTFQNAISIIDAGRTTPEVLELCKYTKYIVCSKEFAEAVTGLKFDFNLPQSLVNVYNKLQNKYPNAILVITLENMGAMCQMGNEIKIMPGLKVQAVDTTAAGDIFHGAFVYGLSNNFDIEKTVTIANIAAGLSVTKMGGRLSIPSLSEVLDYYATTVGGMQQQAPGAQQQVPNQAMQQVAQQQQVAQPNVQVNQEAQVNQATVNGNGAINQ